MSVKRIIDTSFWEDEKVMTMFSPEDKLFFLYLMTNPHTTQIGIYPILTKQMSFELGYSAETIAVLLDRFENKYGVIKYSPTTKEIAIRNYLRYSIVKGGKPVFDLLSREAEKVKDKSLMAYILQGASDSSNVTVQEFCSYITNIYINTNNIYKDNDESYHDSYHDSSEDKLFRAVKHKYGEFKNVLLTDPEAEKLKAKFGDEWEAKVNVLSEGIARKGYKYESHYLAILNWDKRDKEEARLREKNVLPSKAHNFEERKDDLNALIFGGAKK